MHVATVGATTIGRECEETFQSQKGDLKSRADSERFPAAANTSPNGAVLSEFRRSLSAGQLSGVDRATGPIVFSSRGYQYLRCFVVVRSRLFEASWVDYAQMPLSTLAEFKQACGSAKTGLTKCRNNHNCGLL